MAALALLALTAFPSLARAVPEFPGRIADYFAPHLAYTPPCRLCHIDGTTGAGSVQTPFGISMLAHGLTEDRGTLSGALEGLEAGKVDSDGDGVSDTDELVADTDPNTRADVSLSSSDPGYGCAIARGLGGPRRPGGELLVVLLASFAILRSRAGRG